MLKPVKESAELRRFGLIMATVLALLGLLIITRGNGYSAWLIGLSFLLLLAGAGRPMILRPVYRAWMCVSSVLSWSSTRLILILLFYLVFVPIGFLAKLFGVKFLELRSELAADSYWINKCKVGHQRDRYERQF